MLRKFEPSDKKNKMESETDLTAAREYFLGGGKENRVLYHLVKGRYSWMNRYIARTDKEIYELGCGTGISREFIHNKNLKLTDVAANKWLDRTLDALSLDMEDESVDVFILCNVLHHFAYPLTFMKNAAGKLRKGGRILLFEPYTSLALKIPQKLLGLEGWDDDADVFNESVPCCDPLKPWSANNSIPKIMFFEKAEYFEKCVPELRILKKGFCECLMFLNSGGVNYHTFHLPIGDRGCKFLKEADKVLVKAAPQVFAMGCKAVIEKK